MDNLWINEMHYQAEQGLWNRDAGVAGDDSSLLVAVQQRFQESHHQELRNILCECHEGVLTLRGMVTSFYVKQLAQSLVAKVPGVEECDNRIDVRARRA